jgi:hypothetical protein
MTIDLPFNSYKDFITEGSQKVIVIRGTKEHDDIVS